MWESLQRKVDELDRDDVLRLQIHTEPGRLNQAVDMIERQGGEVISSYDTLIIADVPVGRIQPVANSGSVRLAGEFVLPQTLETQSPVIREYELPEEIEVSDPEGEAPAISQAGIPTTEGVEITGANVLHDQGVTGEDVTIAILDSGFNIDNEQYADQVVATLGADPGDPGFEAAYETPGAHGDAVADIVAAMAPDADLILADVFLTIPGFDTFEALDVIEAEHPEVDVVNYSVGHLADFRIDGLDPVSLRIDAFTEATDSIFVNSAGNSAAIENAWIHPEGAPGPIPIPQNIGDAYDSGGTAEFTDRGRALLEFDHHFDEELEVSTRLPITTFEDVATNTGPIGWTITHWDTDPVEDDQIYQARLYPDAESNQPLTVSRTRNPWETIEILAEYFIGNVRVDMEVDDGAWTVTRVDGQPDVAELSEPNPLLTLPEAQRYRIYNEDWPEHPFEFRDAEGNSLLSQNPGTTGAFEDDPNVDWEDHGDWFAFTSTQDLTMALHGNQYVSTTETSAGGEVAGNVPLPIFLEVQRVKADEEHHFDIWASFASVNIPTPWATDPRTLGIPATSQSDDLLSIGAVQAVDLGNGPGETNTAFERNAGDLKGYSSQGPTQDGRRGLDLAGPSHVSTNARGPVDELPLLITGFNGTSAAAPHVTGAVGLLSQVEDDRGEIRQALFDTGTGIPDPDAGPPGPNNTQIGFGQIDVEAAHGVLTD